MPFFRAAAVCEAMQYSQPFVTETATYRSSFVRGSSAPGTMTSLADAHVRPSVTGSTASAFQKLLTQSTCRVSMMSS